MINWLKSLAARILGSRNPRTFTISQQWRSNNASEYSEAAIREPRKGNDLIDLVENCWAASHGLSMVANDVFTGSDPDEQGITVECDDVKIKAILDKVTDSFERDDFIRIVTRFLGYGDAFVEIAFDTKSTQPSVKDYVVLPTWEMFRVETAIGELSHFEQRKYVYEETSIQIPSWKLMHFRFNPKFLYGRSVFDSLTSTWQKLREVSEDIAIATRGTGVVPNVFTMPEWADENYKAAFKNDYQERLKVGAVTDIFLNAGMSVAKLSNGSWNPDIKAMREAYELHKQEIYVALNIPLYLAGLQIKGAAEIARAPQQNYERFIFNIQGIILDEVRKVCGLQLDLHQISRDKVKYKLRMPRYSFSGWDSLEAPEEDNMYSDSSVGRNGNAEVFVKGRNGYSN